MRQIKFRGKRVNNGQWIEGYYGESFREISSDIKTSYIVEMNRRPKGHDIHKETVGQFTGLTDKNGKEIYEGDIIEDKNGIGVIMWFQTAWGVASYAYGYDGLKSYTAVDSFYSKETQEWIVIGNIHDNPELLGKEATDE